jgi:hypothetical protein
MVKTYIDRLTELEFYPLRSVLPETSETIDPFDYKQRMGVYKLLIDATNWRSVCGQENELNVLWGYVFQLDWQWRSGRLQLANTPLERIDPNSIWGYGNYTLSVIPLIAAMESGIVPEGEILPPYTKSDVEYPSGGGKAGEFKIPTALLESVRAWKALFKVLQSIVSGDDLEPLRFELWKAHHCSLLAAEYGIRTLGERYYAPSEVDFLIGWIRMVDFLGAAAWRTDLPFMLENGVDQLPKRTLTAQDRPGQIADMDERVNVNVRSINGLTRQSKLRFGINLWLWKRAMRTRKARDEVLPMLDATFNPSPKNVDERRKLLRYIMAF